MKLSKREKTLLSILFIVVIFYLYYTFLYLPKYSELLTAKELLEKNYTVVRKMEHQIKGTMEEQKIMKNIKLRYDVLESILPSHIYQEEIILLIKDIFEQNFIQLQSVTFQENGGKETIQRNQPSIMDIFESYERILKNKVSKDLSKLLAMIKNEEKEAVNSSENKTNEQNEIDFGADTVRSMELSINFTASYKNLKKALMDLEQNRRKIIIKNISIAGSNQEIVGNLVLSFPYYNIGDNGKKIVWNIHNVYGNINPFYEIGSYIKNFTTEKFDEMEEKNKSQQKENLTMNSDFYIILKPFSSDLPTATIGKYPFRHSEIYCDNKEFEKVTLYIKEENNKWLYRYNNSLMDYPNGEKAWEEFTPYQNEIVLTVLSLSRLNDNDHSGILLSVINKSKKQLNIKVYNDDSINPRVKIYTQKGMIKVINEQL